MLHWWGTMISTMDIRPDPELRACLVTVFSVCVMSVYYSVLTHVYSV